MQFMRAHRGTFFDRWPAAGDDTGTLFFGNVKAPWTRAWNHLPSRCEWEGWSRCGSEIVFRFKTEEEGMVF